MPQGPRRIIGIVIAAAIAAAPDTTVSGPPFFLERTAIVPGGHLAAGGDFSLTSTTGQPVAGRLESGAFVLQAGFWASGSPQVADLIFKDGFE